MLTSLNSLRVIAEFWVVHFHIAPRQLVVDEIVHDLMSFFFVLSGFVLTHTHHDHDLSTWAAKRAFWWRRWSKTYPVYIVGWCLYMVYALTVDHWSHVPTCCWVQLVLFDGWIHCDLPDMSNGASWYISALAWAWLVFPWLLPALCRAASTVGPWILVACFWLVSLGINAAMIPQGPGYSYTFPGLRIFEFAIGCVAATTIHTRLHWLLAMGPVLLLLTCYVMLYAWSFGHDNVCTHKPFYEAAPDSYGCVFQWFNAFHTKSALAWAALLHYIAALEHLDLPHWLS